MSESLLVTPASGELEFVRQFVNTLDIKASTDALREPAAWREWAREQQLDGEATEADLVFARELREALRAALQANHDRAPLPPQSIDALNAAGDRARLGVRFTPDGSRLVTKEQGIEAVFGRIVAAVAAAMADGTWQRLRVCAADDCQWGFYDTSRSRTGQWCSMNICGNRAKQARWRNQAIGAKTTS